MLRHLLREAASAPAGLRAEGFPSVADLAARWLLHRLGPGERVVVIGAGTVGRRVAEVLATTHPVALLYRAHPPAAEWARRHAIELRPGSDLERVLPGVMAVVAAAKTTGRLLEARDVPPPPTAGIRYFVDLGLPRNLDPQIGALPRTALVDLSGLPMEPVHPERLTRLRRQIDELADVEIAELARAALEPALAEIWRQAEGIRDVEWGRALRHAGPISPQAQSAFEKLSERLVRQLLSGPARDLRDRAGQDVAPTPRLGLRPFPDNSSGP